MNKFQEANRLLVAGDAAAAVRLYLEHADECPDDAAKSLTKAAQAYLRLNVIAEPIEVEDGVTLVSEPDKQTAEICFRRALGANEGYVPALLGLARLVTDPNEQVALLEKAVAIREDLLALLELGEHYRTAGDPGRAYSFFRRAQEHNPLDRGGYEGLERVCRELNREEEARDWAAAWKQAYARKPRVDGHGRS